MKEIVIQIRERRQTLVKSTYETHEMETTVAGLDLLERGLDVLQLAELVLGGSKINADNILVVHQRIE